MAALTPAQIATELKTLSGWRHDQGALRRTYKTDGWPTTLMLVNAIGFVCEAADHHPDLAVSWGKVEVSFWTHSEGGITAKDVAMARSVEKATLWRPDGWKGTTKGWVNPET